MAVSDFVYEELLLTVISHKLGKGNDKEETINNINKFLAEEINPDNYFPANVGCLMSILYGNTLCSSSSLILVELMERNNIPARLCSSANHAFAEIYHKNGYSMMQLVEWFIKIQIILFLREQRLQVE